MADLCVQCQQEPKGLGDPPVLADEYCAQCGAGVCEDHCDDEGQCFKCSLAQGETLHDEDCGPNCNDEDHWMPLGPGNTIVRTEAKINRNDPCPCKSGKKYKKCCL